MGLMGLQEILEGCIGTIYMLYQALLEPHTNCFSALVFRILHGHAEVETTRQLCLPNHKAYPPVKLIETMATDSLEWRKRT